MGNIGRRLKEERKSLGFSLREVEEKTKIRKKYLQAIENEDFDSIPGKTYTKGFLKIYAKFLGLNPKEIIYEFEQDFADDFEQEKIDNTPKLKEDITARGNKKLLLIGIVVGIILLLIGFNLFYANVQEDGGPMTSEQPEQNEQVPEDSNENNAENDEGFTSDTSGGTDEITENNENQGQPSTDNVAEEANIKIEIVHKQCWLRVVNDGEEVFQGTLKKGESRSFSGKDEITVTFGDAGAVKVFHNGEETENIGGDGEVVTKTFSVE